MIIKLTPWNSREYWAGIKLRNELLKTSAGESWITKLPLEERQAIHLIASIDETVVGTLMLCKKSNTVMQIKQVAIDQRYQGEGIGKKLLDFAERVAELLTFETIYLTGRSQAWGFYEYLGYHGYGASYQKEKLEMKQFKKKVVKHVCNGKIALTKRLTLKELETNG